MRFNALVGPSHSVPADAPRTSRLRPHAGPFRTTLFRAACLAALTALGAFLAACDDGEVHNPRLPLAPAVPPDHVRVQHVLIGFQGSLPGKTISRSRNEAETLATNLLHSAWFGRDFDTLVRDYTDDQYPGIYGMSNTGIPPGQGEYARTSLIPAFGDVGFSISPGNIGMAAYDPRTSPYGWHLILRLE